MDDSTTIYIGFDLKTLLASPSTPPTTPQISTQVAEQSEANENSGIDTSMFSGYDEVNLLSPSFKIASSIFDETGKLIEFDPQAFETALDHFGKA